MRGYKPRLRSTGDVADSSNVRAFQFGEDDSSLMGDYYAYA